MADETTGDERGTGGDVPIRRRSLLRAVPALGATALAGCGGLTNQTFSASRVSLDDASMSELGLEEITRTTRTDSASREIGPLSGSVTAETKVTVYSMITEGEHPQEADVWSDSEAPLASWAGNSPVRGVRAADALDGQGLTSQADDAIAGSIAANEASILAPEGATSDGSIDPGDALIMACGSGVD